MKESASGILSTTIEKVRQLVDVSTIVGEPIKLSEEITVIPVSKVTYGFASGGSDFPSKNNKDLFGGGGGAGITINPVAFLILKGGEVTLKHITANDNATERIVNMIPDVIDKVSDVADKLRSGKKASAPKAEAPAEAPAQAPAAAE